MTSRATSTPRSVTMPVSAARRCGDRAVAMPGAVSIDMDTLADYAGGYGFAYRSEPDPVYCAGLSRFLDLFLQHGIRATIFVIARDAHVPEHAAILRRAVAEGHELANHTLTHPRRLSGLTDGERREEIVGAHEILSSLAGRGMVGFRAPCYDVCPRTLALLRDMGYRYDSSVHPSLMAPVIDAVVLLKSRFRKWEARPGSYGQLFAPLTPYVPSAASCRRRSRRADGISLLELPLSALPFSRLPFYGTWTQTTGMPLFRRSLAWLSRFNIPLNFHFHAVELLGLEDAGVDERFCVHPGMTRTAADKTRDVDDMLGCFQARYQMMTLEAMAMEYRNSSEK